MDKKKIVNTTVEVLDFFLNIPEAIIYGFDRKEFYRNLHGYYREQELTVKNISQFLYSFKKSGYVEISEINGRESIRFTNKARLAIVDRLSERVVIDGKYYLVSFDIPERLRTKRDNFRRVIKRLGFRQIQKSLWVSNKNLGEMVGLAAEEYGVEDYIVHAIVESIDIKTTLENMFEDKK
ncbi:MAG: hypothetical protein Q7S80_01345 [bacterium]|nr:hypothetical protein [bacterium]